jgi:large subunit ribosomal protein L4
MSKAKLYDKQGNNKGNVELPETAFDCKPNKDVLWQYVKMYNANQRLGTHSAKTRSEIRGGGRKPWRQKGTGRARAGTTSSGLWRSGGVIFPPKPRDYRQYMPKKMKKIAVFEGFDIESPKTSELIKIFDTAKLNINKPILIITNSIENELLLSARNIQNICVKFSGEINAYEVLKAENIIIEQNALEKIEELCKI